MVKGFLILFFLFNNLVFAAAKISDYFGVWKGDAFYGNKKYSVYVSFPGLGEASSCYYKASEEKNKNRGYDGSFSVKEEKENFYKAKIKTGAGKLKTFLFPVEGRLENGAIVLDSFLVKGNISLESENEAVFFFTNEFGDIKGKLKRLTEREKKAKSSKKISKTLRDKNLKPIEKKKI